MPPYSAFASVIAATKPKPQRSPYPTVYGQPAAPAPYQQPDPYAGMRSLINQQFRQQRDVAQEVYSPDNPYAQGGGAFQQDIAAYRRAAVNQARMGKWDALMGLAEKQMEQQSQQQQMLAGLAQSVVAGELDPQQAGQIATSIYGVDPQWAGQLGQFAPKQQQGLDPDDLNALGNMVMESFKYGKSSLGEVQGFVKNRLMQSTPYDYVQNQAAIDAYIADIYRRTNAQFAPGGTAPVSPHPSLDRGPFARNQRPGVARPSQNVGQPQVPGFLKNNPLVPLGAFADLFR